MKRLLGNMALIKGMLKIETVEDIWKAEAGDIPRKGYPY